MSASLFKRWWPWVLGAFACLALLGLGRYFERATRVELSALSPKPGPLVLDRQDRTLRLSPDDRGRRVILLPPGPLPERVVAAFLAAEDGRFRQHRGIDLTAVVRAAWSNLKAGKVVSGASTITQQLARLAYPAPRTCYHKLLEMGRSLRIEAELSKDEILRRYLNLVPLGGNLVGVETAARAYFVKEADQLTVSEAAVLAALAKAPGTLSPHGPNRQRLLHRRDWVLDRMVHLGFISRQDFLAARQDGIPRRRSGSGGLFPFEAPHFVDLVLAAAGSEASGVLRTTLDLDLQRRAQAIVLSHRNRLSQGGVSQAAAVIIHNRTLEVAALVGSFHYDARDQGYNNGAAARRSPGSTLKPFLYAQALDLGFTAAQVLEDVEGRYRTPRGEFIPANFDRFAHGPISFREALGNSLNLSAVNLLNQVGPATFYDLLTRLNLINYPERSADHYGLGLVVGNPEVSLLQLAAAFACLANGGVHRPARIVQDQQTGNIPEHIFSPQAAYIITDILADPMARARLFGSSQAMNPPFRLAIKTGTSTRYRDCWAVGYTPEYTLAVWTGNFDGRPTAGMSGASAAAPILADLVRELGQAGDAPFLTPPAGVTKREVCSFSGLRPGPSCRHRRQELFVAGTEPVALCSFHHSQETWHRLTTGFAGWLHGRFSQQSAGRYRLAGFDSDLERTFQGVVPLLKPRPAASRSPQKVSLGENQTLHLHHTLIPALASHSGPQVIISSPLNGDRFLLPPGQETLILALKASCRDPLPQVTWYINGREHATTGPPYESPLQVGRGLHQVTAVGPNGLGDFMEFRVE